LFERKFKEQNFAVMEEWVSNNSNDWQGPFTSEGKIRYMVW
jgi:hypothetical protein